MKTGRVFDECWNLRLTSVATGTADDLNLQQIVELWISNAEKWGRFLGFTDVQPRYEEFAAAARRFAAAPAYGGQSFRYRLSRDYGWDCTLDIKINASSLVVRLTRLTDNQFTGMEPLWRLNDFGWPIDEILVEFLVPFRTRSRCIISCEFTAQYSYVTRVGRSWPVAFWTGLRVNLRASRSRRWLVSQPKELLAMIQSAIDSTRSSSD